MRTESEIRARLEKLKADKIKWLELKMCWSVTDASHIINTLEWVLGDDEK